MKSNKAVIKVMQPKRWIEHVQHRLSIAPQVREILEKLGEKIPAARGCGARRERVDQALQVPDQRLPHGHPQDASTARCTK